MMYLRLFLIPSLMLTTSCASYFKRKDCEKTNWYQHGYDVAMSGRRLDADDYVKQCQKVEAKMSFSDLDVGFKAGMAKYCTNDNVYEVGKAGKPFAYEMCDGENLHKMKSRHAEGIRVFCTPANAFRFGSSGGTYLNVCPKNLESDWLAEYRKGRKIYLTNAIAEKEKEVQRLDGEIASLESRRAALHSEQLIYANQTEFRTETVVDPNTNQARQQTVRAPSQSGQIRAQQIGNDISQLDFEIRTARSRRGAIFDELSKMRTEVVSL